MNYKLTASAVFCAAFISGCSSAPTLAVPTGEWESFIQQPQPSQFKPTYAPQPLMPPAGFNQGPVTTVFKPNEVVAFTPPPGSTPVKPAVPAIVLPVVEKVPVAPAQALGNVAKSAPGAAPVAAHVLPLPAAPGATKPAIATTSTDNSKSALGKTVGTLALADAKPAAPLPKPLKAWPVSPQDKTIRETLAKWSAIEGYTFNPLGRDYWTVPQDFDVVASDTFYGDYKDAVRKLIASTELTTTPLQPCFFSNKAVRVILINEECAAQASQVRNP